jgi:8-oxo-dGDP phosphatase
MTYEVSASHPIYHGPIFSVVQDEVTMPGGSKAYRDVVKHKDAVAIVALDCHDGSSLLKPTSRIALVYQYRHPLGKRIWELPAGLLDRPGENAQEAAARELEEEVGVTAEDWEPLVTIASSPGFTDETVTVFLASALEKVGRPQGPDDEEADMEVHWVPLEEAVKMVQGGVIVSAHSVAGILAAALEVGHL